MNIEILAPTNFPLQEDDPLASSHRLIHSYLRRIPDEGFVAVSNVNTDWNKIRFLHREAASEILELPVSTQLNCIRACARFSYWSRFEWGWSMEKQEATHAQMGYEGALNNLCTHILGFDREWREEEIKELVELPVPYSFQKQDCVSPIVEKHLQHHSVSDELRESVERVREWNASVYRLPHWLSLGAALGEPFVLHRGEKWADDALVFIASQPEHIQEQWRAFLLHCIHLGKAKPNQKWLTTAKAYIDEIGFASFESCFCTWCADYGQSNPTYELNQAVFKGLVWSASLLSGEETVLALAKVALLAAQPASESTAFSLNLFNACVWSLSQSSNLAASTQLIRLKESVRGSRLRSLDKALQTFAVSQMR